MCPKNAGGDGKTDTFTDCSSGSSGYYANEAASGRGGFLNDLKGVATTFAESYFGPGDCGTKYSCGEVPDFGPGGLEEGMAKTVAGAQRAEVTFTKLGKFTRGIWEVAGKKGAGFVRWSKILGEDGKTMRLFKDVYDQGANFLRRDWYVGGPPK